MSGDFATYLIRSLLSEGRLRYETVEKTEDGLAPKLIEREGPTGLIVTTTSLRLHPENETRMLSLTVTDTREQTAAVFKALANERSGEGIDLSSLAGASDLACHVACQGDHPFCRATGRAGAARGHSAAAGLQDRAHADPRPCPAASGDAPEGCRGQDRCRD